MTSQLKLWLKSILYWAKSALFVSAIYNLSML